MLSLQAQTLRKFKQQFYFNQLSSIFQQIWLWLLFWNSRCVHQLFLLPHIPLVFEEKEGQQSRNGRTWHGRWTHTNRTIANNFVWFAFKLLKSVLDVICETESNKDNLLTIFFLDFFKVLMFESCVTFYLKSVTVFWNLKKLFNQCFSSMFYRALRDVLLFGQLFFDSYCSIQF